MAKYVQRGDFVVPLRCDVLVGPVKVKFKGAKYMISFLEQISQRECIPQTHTKHSRHSSRYAKRWCCDQQICNLSTFATSHLSAICQQ